jgi:hypothetical protein
MKRLLLLLSLLGGAVSSCSSAPSPKRCARDPECPAAAVCVSGFCVEQHASGGASSLASASGRVSAGTITMDAVVGAPVVPNAGGGAITLRPAEVSR